MVGELPGFERGPEPDAYEEHAPVEQGREALAGSSLSRADIISALQQQVDQGELTAEEAFGIAVEVGALPRSPQVKQ